MKKVLLVLLAAFALHAMPVVFAADEPPLPEIAPVDDPVIDPLPDFVPAN